MPALHLDSNGLGTLFFSLKATEAAQRLRRRPGPKASCKPGSITRSVARKPNRFVQLLAY